MNAIKLIAQETELEMKRKKRNWMRSQQRVEEMKNKKVEVISLENTLFL